MDNELIHWGVKGQKWGVRRYQNKDGSLTAAGKARQKDWSDDAREADKIKRKNSLKRMSNQELKKLNERTRLEQEYSRLNPSTINKGFKYVSTVAVATTTALTLINNSDKFIQLGKRFMKK